MNTTAFGRRFTLGSADVTLLFVKLLTAKHIRRNKATIIKYDFWRNTYPAEIYRIG
jgi:hypothetical protein